MPSAAHWGDDDCVTWALPAGAARPAWLADAPTEASAVRVAVRRHGSLRAAGEAALLAAGLARVSAEAPPLAGDRILGETEDGRTVCAVLQGDLLPMERTPSGAGAARLRTVFSRWRVTR